MSGYVRTRSFCCCLPVRFGVFVRAIAKVTKKKEVDIALIKQVLSLLGMVGGAFIAAIGWFQITQLGMIFFCGRTMKR